MAPKDPSDPGLPLQLGPCSNGEQPPVPPNAVARRAVARMRPALIENARRAGMSRRRFLVSAAGAATSLSILNACADEQRAATSTTSGTSTTTAGSFTVPPEATVDTEIADQVLRGYVPIIDDQAHFLEWPAGADNLNLLPQFFSQSDCGLDDRFDCYRLPTFLDLMLNESENTAIVLSSIPGNPSIFDQETKAWAVELGNQLCGDERLVMQAAANPGAAGPEGVVADMEASMELYDVKAWKAYPHNDGPGWFLDDRDPAAPQVGNIMLDTAERLGVTTVAFHKGFSAFFGGEPTYADPVDVGPAAVAHPAIDFVCYHAAYELNVVEGPYDPDEATPQGTNRLIRSILEAGVGPNQNVSVDLGSTWRALMTKPDEAAHLLGKLLLYVGEDNICWGTDSIWYGSPQDQIDAFRVFEISEAAQEEFGYPALTDEVKAKIFGLNGARLFGVDLEGLGDCQLEPGALEEARLASVVGNHTLGPATPEETAILMGLT